MKLPEIKLSIAGNIKDATYYGKIKRHIVENNLESKITIEGYVKDLNDWYNSNDCIISNSIYEGTQTSIVEGVATGCWAISKDWDGADEIVDEKGLFTNVNELETCINRFYEWNGEERNKNIKKARERLISKLMNRPRMHDIILKL